MKSVTHQTTLHLSFKIKCCVDRLRPPGQSGKHMLVLSSSQFAPKHVPGNWEKARRPKASAVSHGQFDILDWRICVCPTPYTRGAPLRNIRATISASRSAKASLGHVSDAPAFDMRHIVHRQCPRP